MGYFLCPISTNLQANSLFFLSIVLIITFFTRLQGVLFGIYLNRYRSLGKRRFISGLPLKKTLDINPENVPERLTLGLHVCGETNKRGRGSEAGLRWTVAMTTAERRPR